MSGVVPSQPEPKTESFVGRPKLRSSLLLSFFFAATTITVQLALALPFVSFCLGSLSVISAAAALFFWRTETPKVMATGASQLKAEPPVIH